MKIIFLNIWWGCLQEKVDEFVKEHRQSTDVFCFQEVNKRSENSLRQLLTKNSAVGAEKCVDENELYRLISFIPKTTRHDPQETLLKKSLGMGLGLSTTIYDQKRVVNICNVHGTPRPNDKLDCPERIQQSKILIETYKSKPGIKIIGGDFNLEPSTESIRLFEENGFRNLISEFQILTTRNELAWKLWPTPKLFSDYLFVSKDVKVKSFSVPKMEISDHLPMILEIEV